MLAIAQDGELDRGATSVAAATERTCALTREVRPISELLRFVVGPAGEAVPDVKRKLPGRGIWVTATRAAIADATERNVFARGFRKEVHVPRDLAAQTERLLERAALDALAIAGKAGAIVGGFAKVEVALGRDDVLALIHAADAADNGKRKLAAALQRNTGGKPGEIGHHRYVYRCPIGFGIEPPKCGTCSPACRTRKRDISRARCASDAFSDRFFARCS